MWPGGALETGGMLGNPTERLFPRENIKFHDESC